MIRNEYEFRNLHVHILVHTIIQSGLLLLKHASSRLQDRLLGRYCKYVSHILYLGKVETKILYKVMTNIMYNICNLYYDRTISFLGTFSFVKVNE